MAKMERRRRSRAAHGAMDPEVSEIRDPDPVLRTQHLLEGDWIMEYRTGVSLAELLMSHIGGTEVQDVYIDEDEHGRYIGVVFTDGENEYHLTFEEGGTVQLAEGPLEGDKLEEVTSFSLADVQPPFSEGGIAEG